MKKLLAILLTAILGVALYAAVEQHRELKRQEHERLEREFQNCLRVMSVTHDLTMCDSIADQLKGE